MVAMEITNVMQDVLQMSSQVKYPISRGQRSVTYTEVGVVPTNLDISSEPYLIGLIKST
jgi:hypothetical protein